MIHCNGVLSRLKHRVLNVCICAQDFPDPRRYDSTRNRENSLLITDPFHHKQEYKFPIGDKINKPEVLEVDSMLCTTEW